MCSRVRIITGHEILVMFFLTIPLSMLSALVVADPLETYCFNNTSNYTLNSPFETNLKRLLETLPSFTSLTGFNFTSVGKKDEVYGRALCRGDINSTTCQACLTAASKEVLKACKSKEAIIWYELCQVHYSFQNMYTVSIYTGKYPDWWNFRQKNVTEEADHFYSALLYIMSNLSNEAAFNPSKLMFAAGAIEFSRSVTIYGLVQCTRDITESDCRQCLNSALIDLQGCCSSREGGMVLSRNCNVRFELDKFYNSSSYLLTYSTSKRDKWKILMVAFVVCIPIVLAIALCFCVVCLCKKGRKDKDVERSHRALLQELASPKGVTVTEEGRLVSSDELPSMDLDTIRAATENFCDSNKLGQGGFGTVYKGILQDGKEVAVKRLSRKSWQGLEEFKNEVILIAKLQHRNLVRLVGCGMEGAEKLLVYEFMPNKSLDVFIFDSEKRIKLDWQRCYNIICGIARGLLYLHEDSRLKIIHRDLKPNNVLLDHEMVAKISDFGMARIFGENQNTANTRRVVGTYGYMAPEYAMEGLFSVKSDVFSFGVILLEILSGKKSTGFCLTEHGQTLLAYAWRLWNEGKEMEFVDPLLKETSSKAELVRFIHIGLLCVQEDPADRPTMSFVVTMLESDPMAFPQPKQPAFCIGKMVHIDKSSSSTDPSLCQMTVSSVSPR